MYMFQNGLDELLTEYSILHRLTAKMGKLRRTTTTCIPSIWPASVPFFAQTRYLIAMDPETHHHIALHNNYVNVLNM